jgi:hypothetical protein
MKETGMGTFSPSERVTPLWTSTQSDRLRQALNVVLSITQVVAICWTFLVNTNFSFDERAGYEPPVIPAGYTFTVWFVIYAGAFVYAVYQALPQQRTNPLLRRIGWWTSGAYGAATIWAILAGLNLSWLTVLFMFTLFATLLGAFIGCSRAQAP